MIYIKNKTNTSIDLYDSKYCYGEYDYHKIINDKCIDKDMLEFRDNVDNIEIGEKIIIDMRIYKQFRYSHICGR